MLSSVVSAEPSDGPDPFTLTARLCVVLLVKGGKVARLVYLVSEWVRGGRLTANVTPYLVNVHLLPCKAEVLDTLVFDAPQKVITTEHVDDDVLERRAVCIAGT